MPPAFGFQSGSRCGPVEACATRVLAQPRVRAVHVAHDDRDVLEPAIVAARVGRHRPPARRQVLGQLDRARRRAAAATTRMRSAEDARRAARTPSPATSTSRDLLEAEHVACRSRRERSEVATRSMPIAYRRRRRGRVRAARRAGANAGDEQRSAGAAQPARAVHHREPLQQVIADAQRVRHDRQRRVHRAARREEAARRRRRGCRARAPCSSRRAPTSSDRGRSGSCRSGARRRRAGCAAEEVRVRAGSGASWSQRDAAFSMPLSFAISRLVPLLVVRRVARA